MYIRVQPIYRHFLNLRFLIIVLFPLWVRHFNLRFLTIVMFPLWIRHFNPRFLTIVMFSLWVHHFNLRFLTIVMFPSWAYHNFWWLAVVFAVALNSNYVLQTHQDNNSHNRNSKNADSYVDTELTMRTTTSTTTEKNRNTKKRQRRRGSRLSPQANLSPIMTGECCSFRLGEGFHR